MKRLLKEGRRESAMSILKLKKIRESQVSKCQASYLKLEEMVRESLHVFASEWYRERDDGRLQIKKPHGKEDVLKLRPFRALTAVHLLRVCILELKVMSIESAQVNVSVMESLKIGNASLAKLNSIMSVEAVEAILSDHDEEIEKQREIDVLLAGEFAHGIDDELESELKALMEEEGISSPAVTATPPKPNKDPLQDLPDAPRHAVELGTATPAREAAKMKHETTSPIENDYDALDELASLNAPTHKVTTRLEDEVEAEEDGNHVMEVAE